jgi:hypothetical protein
MLYNYTTYKTPKPFPAEILCGCRKNGAANRQYQFYKAKHYALLPFFTCFYVGELRVYQFLELFKNFQNSYFPLTLNGIFPR